MSINIHDQALMVFLKAKHPTYHGRILDLRDAITRWLSHIPHTFTHYTQHTVEHSDTIIARLSQLLFDDGNPERCTLDLSACEAFILIAGAYLHDSGMVVSDREKVEILASEDWHAWTGGEGGGAKRWRDIEAFQKGNSPADKTQREFLVNIQIRFLIAEFVRRTHHLRAARVMTELHNDLGQYALNDPMLFDTIADVCIAHGLQHHEMEDTKRYPDRRDIDDQKVNVRLLAILLRIGDLLDMSCQRACPMLLSAASPLPPDSLAHWSQYQRITHFMVAPDKIEVHAKCQYQDEHRQLQDWCQWLVEEIDNSRRLMLSVKRHRDWNLPTASMTNPATIVIEPSEIATYKPYDWKFELDQTTVLQRLIQDVYDDPSAFIRELIQNALDATRCKMYSDLKTAGLDQPEYPTQVNEEIRESYTVHISLKEREQRNPQSGEMETQQVLTVEDSGIGMNADIIQRYFLQVGRSYYITEEFRRKYHFVPTSQFGIGFLSVFAVSDHVTVDTKAITPETAEPICLTLTGPRSYLLIDKGTRHAPGTRISAVLRQSMQPGELTDLISELCRRVEFPIEVDDLDVKTIIRAECPEQFTYEMPVVGEEGAKFIVRAFPVDRLGIEGGLYVLAYIDEKGESWAHSSWATHTYPDTHPQATKPDMPTNLVCLHGITVSEEEMQHSTMRSRVDYRRKTRPTLSRTSSRSDDLNLDEDADLIGRWEEIMEEHLRLSPLATSDDAWRYRQRLVDIFPLQAFWSGMPNMIPVYLDGKLRSVSLYDVQRMTTLITSIMQKKLPTTNTNKTYQDILATVTDIPTIIADHIGRLSITHRTEIFRNRDLATVRWLQGGCLVIEWRIVEEAEKSSDRREEKTSVAKLSDPNVIGIQIHRTTDSFRGHCILNHVHPFVQWFLRIEDACKRGEYGLREEQFRRVKSLLISYLNYRGNNLQELAAYLDGWRKIPNLSVDLYPPDIVLSDSMFDLHPPQSSHNNTT